MWRLDLILQSHFIHKIIVVTLALFVNGLGDVFNRINLVLVLTMTSKIHFAKLALSETILLENLDFVRLFIDSLECDFFVFVLLCHLISG